MIGKTNLRQALRLCMGAKAVVGSVSGLTMVAAAKGARSVVLWPDHRSKRPLPEAMQTSWIKDRPHYVPLGYSAGIRAVMSATGSVWRGK